MPCYSYWQLCGTFLRKPGGSCGRTILEIPVTVSNLNIEYKELFERNENHRCNLCVDAVSRKSINVHYFQRIYLSFYHLFDLHPFVMSILISVLSCHILLLPKMLFSSRSEDIRAAFNADFVGSLFDFGDDRYPEYLILNVLLSLSINRC